MEKKSEWITIKFCLHILQMVMLEGRRLKIAALGFRKNAFVANLEPNV